LRLQVAQEILNRYGEGIPEHVLTELVEQYALVVSEHIRRRHALLTSLLRNEQTERMSA